MFRKDLELDVEAKQTVQKNIDDILNGKVQHFIILGYNDKTGEVINLQSGHGIILNGLLHDAELEHDLDLAQRKNLTPSSVFMKLFNLDNKD